MFCRGSLSVVSTFRFLHSEIGKALGTSPAAIPIAPEGIDNRGCAYVGMVNASAIAKARRSNGTNAH